MLKKGEQLCFLQRFVKCVLVLQTKTNDFSDIVLMKWILLHWNEGKIIIFQFTIYNFSLAYCNTEFAQILFSLFKKKKNSLVYFSNFFLFPDINIFICLRFFPKPYNLFLYLPFFWLFLRTVGFSLLLNSWKTRSNDNTVQKILRVAVCLHVLHIAFYFSDRIKSTSRFWCQHMLQY